MGNGPTKEEKLIKKIATKETELECPILVDLDHGTIRHRHEEHTLPGDNKGSGQENTTKIGYFYHPRLNDFSEDALMTYSENNRLKYVFRGPPKDTGKKLYYIYGTRSSDKDHGIKHEDYKPQGKGYNWPQSYRKSNNLYYDVIFQEVAEVRAGDDSPIIDEDRVSRSQSSGIDSSMDSEINAGSKDKITLQVGCTETVGSVIERISLQLLIPSSNIHLMINKSEIIINEILGDFRSEGSRTHASFTITLRLT